MKETWKIGELAKQTGLTVRALHHYDKIGLLSPSQHSESGHRRYSEADIGRLTQIISLKQLGFALEEIKTLIDNPGYDPGEVIQLQLEKLNDQIRIQEQLREQLSGIYAQFQASRDVTAKQFIQLIEVMKLYDNNLFSPEQIEKLKARGAALDTERGRMQEREFSSIVESMRNQMEAGTSPNHPDVVKMAKRWKEINDLLTGGNPEIIKAAERYYAENPGKGMLFGIDGPLYRYFTKALSNT